MQSTLELIDSLSDSEVVRVAKELFGVVYTQVPYSHVRDNSPGVPEIDLLSSLNRETMKQELSPMDSARFGRLLLEQFARDPGLAPLVQQACEKVHASDNLILDLVLTVGVIANLTLLVATTKVKVQKESDGKTTVLIDKGRAGTGELKAVLETIVQPLFKLLRPTS